MALETDLETAVLAPVMNPIESAHGLPNEAYVSEQFARLERDRLLARSWTCIGVASEVPEPGDVKPVTLLGLPLILLRDRAGAIRVFHNVCSHRGHELVTEPGKVSAVLRCPYHAWAYGLDGALRTTPNIGGPGQATCAGFDKARHGLKAVRTAVWFDVVFVNLSGEAPDFAEQVAPLAERWAAFDPAQLRHGGEDSILRFDLNCNWKLAVENYCEGYHLPTIHPGLNSYSRLEDHYNIEEDGFSGQGSTAFAPRLLEGGPELPRFTDLPDYWNGRAEYVALFPNVLLGIHDNHFYAVHIEPRGAGRSIENFHIYYVGEEPLGEDFAALRVANAEAWCSIFEEDRGVVESMQRGRASPAFDGGVFSPAMDGPTHFFHKWVAAGLMLAEPAAVAAE